MKTPSKRPTAYQLARAIEARSVLELKLAHLWQRSRVIQRRLHELDGVSELAYWLKLYALERRIAAHRRALSKLLNRL